MIGEPLVRICNPHALNISICNAIIGLKILILYTSGLQIPMSAWGGITNPDERLGACVQVIKVMA